jgi:hypothetical protein
MFRRILLLLGAVAALSAFSFADGIANDPQVIVRPCSGSNSLVFQEGFNLYDATAQTQFLAPSGQGEVCYANQTGQTLGGLDITASGGNVGDPTNVFNCSLNPFFTNCSYTDVVDNSITFHFFGTDEKHPGIVPFQLFCPIDVALDRGCSTVGEFDFVQEGFNDDVSYTAAGTPVPEPTTALLLASGFAGAEWRRRRKR